MLVSHSFLVTEAHILCHTTRRLRHDTFQAKSMHTWIQWRELACAKSLSILDTCLLVTHGNRAAAPSIFKA